MPEDFRKQKTRLQKFAIAMSLCVVRLVGSKPERKETKEEVRARRKSYLPELVDAGYSVEKKTNYHFRVNGRLDVYPTNAKWHDIETGRRGSFAGRNLATFVRRFLKEI